MTGGTQYLRAADVVRLTGMSIRTIRRWIANGTLPSTKLGGARFVAKSDLGNVLSPLINTDEDTPVNKQKNQSVYALSGSLVVIHVPGMV